MLFQVGAVAVTVVDRHWLGIVQAYHAGIPEMTTPAYEHWLVPISLPTRAYRCLDRSQQGRQSDRENRDSLCFSMRCKHGCGKRRVACVCGFARYIPHPTGVTFITVLPWNGRPSTWPALSTLLPGLRSLACYSFQPHWQAYLSYTQLSLLLSSDSNALGPHPMARRCRMMPPRASSSHRRSDG
jgi:hypothetical protein